MLNGYTQDYGDIERELFKITETLDWIENGWGPKDAKTSAEKIELRSRKRYLETLLKNTNNSRSMEILERLARFNSLRVEKAIGEEPPPARYVSNADHMKEKEEKSPIHLLEAIWNDRRFNAGKGKSIDSLLRENPWILGISTESDDNWRKPDLPLLVERAINVMFPGQVSLSDKEEIVSILRRSWKGWVDEDAVLNTAIGMFAEMMRMQLYAFNNACSMWRDCKAKLAKGSEKNLFRDPSKYTIDSVRQGGFKRDYDRVQKSITILRELRQELEQTPKVTRKILHDWGVTDLDHTLPQFFGLSIPGAGYHIEDILKNCVFVIDINGSSCGLGFPNSDAYLDPYEVTHGSRSIGQSTENRHIFYIGATSGMKSPDMVKELILGYLSKMKHDKKYFENYGKNQ